VVLLVLMAVFWLGWLLWGVLLMATGMRHPQVPVEPGIGSGRRLLAACAVVMLALAFVPAPFGGAGALSLFR